MLDHTSLAALADAVRQLEQGFADLPAFQAAGLSPEAVAVLQQVASRMQDNYPYFHPLYAGQMLKPPHPLARAAYMLAMWINPNNHALDGGRASSAMEKAAVAEIAQMFAWPQHLGHLTSGGTMANLEALWIAGQLHPGKKIVASSQAHYTHGRIFGVLKLDFSAIATDARGKLDLAALEDELRGGEVGTVVVTLGTTGLGSLDPLPEIIALQEHYGFRIHVDAAYGGYFGLADNLSAEARAIYAAVVAVDSIVIDPHKHGLQPYGCGCVLFRDPSLGRLYKHDSPYTYFSSDELHLGEISLECSRAGAGAVALWATQQLLPLVPGGEFAQGLSAGRLAALRLHAHLHADPRFLTLLEPELDILIFACNQPGSSALSAASQQLFERAGAAHLELALIELPASLIAAHWPQLVIDSETVTCLRSCLMKPEHLDWLPQIVALLDQLVPAA